MVEATFVDLASLLVVDLSSSDSVSGLVCGVLRATSIKLGVPGSLHSFFRCGSEWPLRLELSESPDVTFG